MSVHVKDGVIFATIESLTELHYLIHCDGETHMLVDYMITVSSGYKPHCFSPQTNHELGVRLIHVNMCLKSQF